MFLLYYDGRLLHDPRTDVQVTSGELDLEVNAAGSLEFSIPPGHPLAGLLMERDPGREVTVLEDGDEIFRGPVLEVVQDADTVATVTCRGQLVYLDDTVVRPYGTYPDKPAEGEEPQWTTIAPGTQREYAEWLVAQHNAAADGLKRFEVEACELPATGIVRSSTQWPTTANEILDKVLEPLGCVLSAGFRDGVRTLRFTSTPKRSAQRVEFGRNIADIKVGGDYSGVVTCIVPECSAISDDVDDPDVRDYPDGPVGACFKKDDRIWHVAGEAAHGIIEERRSYEADTLAGLVEQVTADLEGARMPVETIDLDVVDMHQVDGSIPAIRLGNVHRVTSKPNGVDQWMMASAGRLNICDPADGSWTFGALKGSLTRGTAAQVQAVGDAVAGVVQEAAAISAEAKAAAQLAGTKQRVFYSEPVPPYDVGDIWVVGDGSIRYCTESRAVYNVWADISATVWADVTALTFEDLKEYA